MRGAFHHRISLLKAAAVFSLFLFPGWVLAQPSRVTGRVEIHSRTRKNKSPDASGVVVWLTPVGASLPQSALPVPSSPQLRLVQKNKQFEPHLLVVPVGASVEFPNRDPFFHNVFSLFEGKRFDLGLYEAGTTRNVHFDKPGISYIFCNIHAEMSAVVIALDTPYYAISTSRGDLSIPNVPAGRYQLRVWSEVSLPDELKDMTREITVAGNSTSLGTLEIAETQLAHVHKNKYGRDYDRPAPSSPVYEQR
jgi:plastocyanin